MPFNSASDAFQLHPDVRSYGTYLRNLIDDEPSFWSSDELWETLETGEVLAIDYEHFSSVLYRRLRVDAEARARGRPSDADAARLLDLVDEYVGAENFSLLCQKTLQFLNEDDLCAFTRGLLPASALEDPETATAVLAGGAKDDARGGGNKKKKTTTTTTTRGTEREPGEIADPRRAYPYERDEYDDDACTPRGRHVDPRDVAAAAAFAGVRWAAEHEVALACDLATRARFLMTAVEEGVARGDADAVAARDAVAAAAAASIDVPSSTTETETETDADHLALLQHAASGVASGSPEDGRLALLLESFALRCRVHGRGDCFPYDPVRVVHAVP